MKIVSAVCIAWVRKVINSDDQLINQEDVNDVIRHFAGMASLIKIRTDLAHYTAETFEVAGSEVYALGSAISDTKLKNVPCRQSEEAIAVSLLLRVAAQLASASADLFSDNRHYAAAALLRQLVEVEYLAWAIDERDQDGEHWLKSDRSQRRNHFSPTKLRQAAQGKFRGKDYNFHCEFGGHPTPMGAAMLLTGNKAREQIMFADLLGHAGRIWDHIVRWARQDTCGEPIVKRNRQMSMQFNVWKSKDPLTRLPPPPLSNF